MTFVPRVLDKMNIYRIYHKPRQNRQNICLASAVVKTMYSEGPEERNFNS